MFVGQKTGWVVVGPRVVGTGVGQGRKPGLSNRTKPKFSWKPSTTPRPAAGESKMGRGPFLLYRLGPTHTRASSTGEPTLFERLAAAVEEGCSSRCGGAKSRVPWIMLFL